MTVRSRVVAAVIMAAASSASAQSDSMARAAIIPAGSPLPATGRRPDGLGAARAERVQPTADVFADSLYVPAPPRAWADSAAPEPTWDMDVRSYESQERVAHYVSMFSGRAKERIAERLSAGSRFEPMIRARMKAGGVPEDMYYLALVESGFNPHAYSRAAAVGMWQFMTSTARDMGLRVDRWVDERRDPVRSTTAAVAFIRGLRDQFGSLYLAAAAYNGGPGRVARGLTKYADDIQAAEGEDAFFVLAGKDYLKTETRDYVPQLIAAALVGKDPARYGMELHVRPAFAYDSVRVPGATPMSAIARAAGATMADVSELNPHLLRGMTPPRESFLVRIPPGGAARFDSLFALLPHADLVATRSIESKKGDTPARVANAHGIPESALRAFNPAMHTLKSGRLAPGQAILLPTVAVALAVLDVPDPGIKKYPGNTASATARKASRKGKSGAGSKAGARFRAKKGAAVKRKSAG